MTKKISLLEALIPILGLVLLLSYNVFVYRDSSLGGANQLALLIASGIALIIGIRKKFSVNEMFKGVEANFKSTSSAIIILLLIGALAGTWMISGIVPAMIYYGLQMIHPKIFLVACIILSALVSLATGSSWSTVATIGVALLGMGKALGMSDGMVAGAIISGAYFGDKMSPLSDTTNLAPAMAGAELFSHIKYMLYTTIPTISITTIVFLIIGFFGDSSSQLTQIEQISNDIKNTFNIHIGLFIVPAIVLFLVYKKVAAIPALFIGVIAGGIFAVIFQPEIIMQLAETKELDFKNYYRVIVDAMTVNTSLSTDNEMLDNLLSTRGMKGMLGTIWLILSAMTFGGILEKIGALKKISDAILKKAKGDRGTFIAASGTCLFLNVTASDQALSIVVSGKMYVDAFKEKGLDPRNLSRTLEDAGTVTSVLVPWNTCGATQSAVLGVSTLTYLPFAMFNYLSPLMTILVGILDIKIARLKK